MLCRATFQPIRVGFFLNIKFETTVSRSDLVLWWRPSAGGSPRRGGPGAPRGLERHGGRSAPGDGASRGPERHGGRSAPGDGALRLRPSPPGSARDVCAGGWRGHT